MAFYHHPLFSAVQNAQIFPDSKTFADAIPQQSWQHACDLYDQTQPQANELAAFVNAQFSFAATPELEPLVHINTVQDYIKALWPKLARPANVQPRGSLLALSHPYTVPGGRFNEIYYWDTYFTALGLIDDGDTTSVYNMLENFIGLINQYGHVPNGNRSYYISRSQPPVTALLVELLWPYYAQNSHWVERVTHALETEYLFWMARDDVNQSASLHVVVMPCGTLLNRYWDNDPSPRPESYFEDTQDSAHLNEHQQHAFYRNLRAACESGWDFSARWLTKANELTSINTTNVVPVDLNALMYQLELTLSRCHLAHNDSARAQRWQYLALKRKKAIIEYFWNAKRGIYCDWLHQEQTQSSVESLATVVPLFVGISPQDHAKSIAHALQMRFLKPGGLVSTLTSTPQQWDSPNGWAPLQWFAVSGLMRYQHHELARTVASHWVNMIELSFEQNQCLLEKYNVCDLTTRASGGEYQVQQGFGWTNGVTSRFYRLLAAWENNDDLYGLYHHPD